MMMSTIVKKEMPAGKKRQREFEDFEFRPEAFDVSSYPAMYKCCREEIEKFEKLHRSECEARLISWQQNTPDFKVCSLFHKGKFLANVLDVTVKELVKGRNAVSGSVISSLLDEYKVKTTSEHSAMFHNIEIFFPIALDIKKEIEEMGLDCMKDKETELFEETLLEHIHVLYCRFVQYGLHMAPYETFKDLYKKNLKKMDNLKLVLDSFILLKIARAEMMDELMSPIIFSTLRGLEKYLPLSG